MHCDMNPLIVTIAEIHMQIVDVCVCLSHAVQSVLMHYMITIFLRRPDYRNIAGFHFEDSQIYDIPMHLIQKTHYFLFDIPFHYANVWSPKHIFGGCKCFNLTIIGWVPHHSHIWPHLES